MKKLLLLNIILFALISCKKQEKPINQIPINKSDNQQNSIPKLDLDTCASTEVSFDKEYLTHKNFDQINQADTIRISDNVTSVKRSTSVQSEDDVLLCYSSISLFDNGNRFFFQDSILTSGIYCFSPHFKKIIIPIITSQNENFSTESTLYLCNVGDKNSCDKIQEGIVNCTNGYLTTKGDAIIYNDADKLVRYDIKSKTKRTIIDFDYPTITIIKLSSIEGSFYLYYVKDFSNYPDIIMKKACIGKTENFE